MNCILFWIREYGSYFLLVSAVGALIIISRAVIDVLKWRRKLRIRKICEKIIIINDFDRLYGELKAIKISEFRQELIEKYKLSDNKATDCIKYLKENGHIVYDTTRDLSNSYWIKQ